MSEIIFDKLDVQGIKNCREVNHSWRHYLDSEYKLHQIRVVKRTIKKFTQLDESWIEFFHTVNSETIKNLRIKMDHFAEKRLGSKSDWIPDKIASFLKNILLVNNPFRTEYLEDFKDIGAEGILDNWIGLDCKQGQFGIKFRTKKLTTICISLKSTEVLNFSTTKTTGYRAVARNFKMLRPGLLSTSITERHIGDYLTARVARRTYL